MRADRLSDLEAVAVALERFDFLFGQDAVPKRYLVECLSKSMAPAFPASCIGRKAEDLAAFMLTTTLGENFGKYF